MDFEKFVGKYKNGGKIDVIFVGIPTKTGEITITKVKNKPIFVLKADNDIIETGDLSTFIKNINKKYQISELRALNNEGRVMDSTQFKQPEVVKVNDEGYKPSKHSLLYNLLNPIDKPDIDALKPNEYWNKMMEERRIKMLARQRSADANIIKRIRYFYNQDQITALSARARNRYLGLQNYILSINQSDISQDPGRIIDNIQNDPVLSGIDVSARDLRTQQALKKNIEALPGPKFDPNFTIKPDDNTCSICITEMEPFEKLCKLGCGHTYHCDCISKWLKMPLSDFGREIKGVCAMCRAPVESITTNEPTSEKSSFGLSSELKYLLSL